MRSEEEFYWADAAFFDVAPMPAIAGDLRAALRRPDGMVVTREIARKYFGRDDPLGQIIEVTTIR